jgi:solute carrier family 50 protein (sugar transporter)
MLGCKAEGSEDGTLTFLLFLIVIIPGILNSEPKLWTANAVGICLSIYYFLSFIRFAPKGIKTLPGSVDQHIQGFLALLATILYFAKSKAPIPIGNIGVFINLAMYASPLAALKVVLDTKSAESIPLPFTVASLLSCLLWSIVGYIDMKDVYVYFPAMLGIICGIMQISLKLIYADKESESQLSPDLKSVEVKLS